MFIIQWFSLLQGDFFCKLMFIQLLQKVRNDEHRDLALAGRFTQKPNSNDSNLPFTRVDVCTQFWRAGLGRLGFQLE